MSQSELRDETPAEEALRSLAAWLGVGGYNAPTVDAEVFKRKIMDGVSMLAEGVPDALRYRWLRVRGAAFAGDPKRHLEDGLVYRIDNLDEAIDREMRLAASGVIASEAPRYWCNKCGYSGPDLIHQRPNGSGECGYIGRLDHAA